jgi:TrpR family trp operon transcriptional repressor
MPDAKTIVQLILSTKNHALLEDFFMGLTTDKEREEILQRIEIIRRLLLGEPQHKIAAELGVGVATVTRGSKELAQGRFKLLRKEIEDENSHN